MVYDFSTSQNLTQISYDFNVTFVDTYADTYGACP
jgi:hypothetical protein